MRRYTIMCLLGLFLTNTGCAFPKGKMTVQVTDRSGEPIVGAAAKVYFYEASSFNREYVSDANGQFVVEGRCDGSIGGGLDKEGYYRQGFGYAWKYKERDKLLNRLTPWNPTVMAVMKDIRDPVPMVHKRVSKRIPVFGESVAFDLEKGDFVVPHGAGVQTDLIFTAVKMSNVLDGATITLAFPNEADGIMPYMFDEKDTSWFKWPYEAPREGYASELSKYEMTYEKVVDYSELYPGHTYKETLTPIETDCLKDEEINYIFRVRSEVDDEGNLIRACYGKIQGEIRVWRTGGMEFRYWFNPDGTPNLEDDPRRNIDLGWR